MSRQVVTRFAPSPTGLLHIGGARTALFNWLFARKQRGRFLLRVEDTDRNRSTPEATQAILDGLSWLGLTWDGDAVSQSTRVDRHRDVANQLLAAGRAYRCFATQQEIAAERKAAQKARRPFRFRSPWRDRQTGLPDEAHSIRLRAPREGETLVEDAVQGKVTWKNRELDDLILLRSDGTPTYMLAVVVDDHDMEVTHVIRGADHLTNAARQTQIFDALDWNCPVFAHVPLIHGPDGTRYSKRHGAIGIGEFEARGYLPEAVRNYLARLGWSHGDQEFFTTDELIRLFSLKSLNRASARFDDAKLLSLNADHLRSMPDETLINRLGTHLGLPDGLAGEKRRRLARLLDAFRPRVRTLVEFADMAQFLLQEEVPEMDTRASKLLNDDNRLMIRELTRSLSAPMVWEPGSLETVVRSFADSRGAPLGKVAQPVRAALTGRSASPGIFDVMSVLGQTVVLERLRSVSSESETGGSAVRQE